MLKIDIDTLEVWVSWRDDKSTGDTCPHLNTEIPVTENTAVNNIE